MITRARLEIDTVNHGHSLNPRSPHPVRAIAMVNGVETTYIVRPVYDDSGIPLYDDYSPEQVWIEFDRGDPTSMFCAVVPEDEVSVKVERTDGEVIPLEAGVPTGVPYGWRLLTEGETLRAGDRWLRPGGDGWRKVNSTGARWNPEGHWPVIRKEEA